MAARFDSTLARRVAATDTLEPRQQKTAFNFKRATDFRQQVMLKHPFLSDFHSRAEHLHAGLLEGDPEVISYTPQPFRLRAHGRLYTPDAYVLDRQRRVVELKPRGEMAEETRTPLEHFFARHGMRFEVVSNESVFEREVEAENWLEIVRILHLARELSTADAEQRVFELLSREGPTPLGKLIDAGDREHTYLLEIALFRLVHQGHVAALLTERPLDFDTEVSLCP